MLAPQQPSPRVTPPRLMAFDLDGTLLDPTGSITPRTVTALKSAHDCGIRIVLATGRPPFMMGNLIEAVGPAITHGVMANGAVVCTFPDGQALHTVMFGIDRAVDTITRLRMVDHELGFAIATDVGFAAEPGFAARMPIPSRVPTSPDVLGAIAGATVAAKLLVFHPHIGTHDLIDELAQHLGSDLHATHMGTEVVEIGPTGVDKASGLKWLCDHLEVDAVDVIAFGDNTNDNSMLVWAGRGVAMNNAPELTRKLATDVTSTNGEDGVAAFIEKLLIDLR